MEYSISTYAMSQPPQPPTFSSPLIIDWTKDDLLAMLEDWDVPGDSPQDHSRGKVEKRRLANVDEHPAKKSSAKCGEY